MGWRLLVCSANLACSLRTWPAEPVRQNSVLTQLVMYAACSVLWLYRFLAGNQAHGSDRWALAKKAGKSINQSNCRIQAFQKAGPKQFESFSVEPFACVNLSGCTVAPAAFWRLGCDPCLFYRIITRNLQNPICPYACPKYSPIRFKRCILRVQFDFAFHGDDACHFKTATGDPV